MGEGKTATVGESVTRGPRSAGGRPNPGSWWKAAASVATAFALSLPLFGLAETITSPPAFAAPDEPCVAVNSVLPATKSAREATAAKAAAQWFPADQVAMATAIAGAESSWNPTAVNKAARGNYGLWQINSVHDKLLDAKNWRTPVDNAWMAYQVWDAADGDQGQRARILEAVVGLQRGQLQVVPARERSGHRSGFRLRRGASPGPRSASRPGTCC